MKNKKVLALILAIAAVLSAVALSLVFLIGGDSDNGGDGTPPVNPGISSGGDYVSKLPASPYSGQVYRVAGMTDAEQQYTNFEVAADGMTGDVMGDAVYERNELIKQKYGFTIDADLFDSMTNEINTEMQGYFEAQDDMYDLCLFRARYIGGFAKSGYLKDLNSVKYLDFDHPTWDKNMNEELTVGSKLYFTTNNFLLQNKSRTPLVFYNREMARSQGIIEMDEYLEETHVDTNNWTLSVFHDMIKEQGYDLGGNGIAGELDDHFGLAADDRHSFTTFCQGAGFRFSSNDGGVITLNAADTQMVNIVTEVGKFGFDSAMTLYSHVLSDSWYDAENSFAAKRALFHAAYIGSYENLAFKADFEYGALPYPKYNASQPRYYSHFDDEFGTVISIPFTCYDLEKAGYMLEAVSEESETTTFPIFIKDKCQLQDAYDEVAAKKLELIFDSLTLDFAAIYDPNGIKTMMGTELMSYKKANRFKALYDRKYTPAVEVFEELMDEFALHGQ